MEFSWDHLYQDLLLGAPNTLRIVSSMVTSSIPMPVPSKEFHHALFAIGIILHGRNREATTLQYLNGMVLLHGGCTHQDMKRLAKLGVCVFPETVRNKLQSWQSNLDEKLLEVKEKWCKGDSMTYQLVGDNWDKNIVPSYRTSKNSTQSIHLFNVIGVIDRIVIKKEEGTPVRTVDSMTAVDFIPSEGDIDSLQKELTFLVARSVIQNIKQMEDLFGKIYPGHLEHIHSNEAGMKTSQYSLGLFDCDEKKTADVIRLLQNLTEKYVPKKDGEIVEEVFFGGDRLTDEKIQVAQQAMRNADSGLERLEGFISKIEDFHRLMNFLENCRMCSQILITRKITGLILLKMTISSATSVIQVFRLTALHQNLNSAVDMGDGYRVVRSAKFETPIYNRTNKVKYLIGSVHLTALVSGTLPAHQSKRLIANRFINISGGKNNNLSLDEFVEILNRDTKNATHGFQTKDSIVQHSKEFPHLVHAVKHFDAMCEVKKEKGFTNFLHTRRMSKRF
ncbi:uncharacterized protein LOC128229766 isoform X1 [Mya arenaria]|uniref:uncharacterized protein LOC128229766 isoform X1 n=1 Tax=Mya arenaria TaxID=6604 RepID=UPI0022E67544|nr:uncharacterized protein LOC128229766 isoform X1 [Mya arenaria]